LRDRPIPSRPIIATKRTLSERLYQLGFSSSVADSSLFIYLANDITMFMLVYVDDIVITSSSPKATRQLLQQLSVSFPMKDLG
jgi:hypothetical protein